MAKFLQETETLDTNGEYSKITKTFTTKSEEPAFIKLYVEHMLSFKNLSKTLNPILLEFLKYMSYATDKQLIYLNAAMKREIAKKTNKSFKRVEQALTEFVKSEIFKRIAVATYQVNPFLFGKGDWKDIKNIRATYNYAENKIEQVEIETFENKEIGIITKTKNEEILIQSFKNELKKTEPHPDQIPLIENEKSCPHCDEKLKLKKDKSEYYCPNFFSKDEQKKCKGHTEKNIYFGDKNPNSIIEQIKKTDLESCKKLLFGYDKKTLIEIAQQVKVSIKNNDSKERIVEKIHFDLVSFGENWNAMTRGVKD